jgi:hypothetical protein
LVFVARNGSPSNATRAVVPLRERILRVAFAVVRVDTPRFDAARDAVRATTLRVDVAPFVAPDGRDATLRDATPRDAFAFVVAVVGRADVAVDVPRGDARPERGEAVAAAGAFSNTGAIGSANTTRIDNNVEHTKNAPISNSTVPSAFLHKFMTERLFI